MNEETLVDDILKHVRDTSLRVVLNSLEHSFSERSSFEPLNVSRNPARQQLSRCLVSLIALNKG